MGVIGGDQYLMNEKSTRGPRKGRVVFNEDPTKKGRIKCTIAGFLESTNPDELPWCYPEAPSQSGGQAQSGTFHVPDVGSEVMIKFPYDDPYMPVYTGVYQSETSHAVHFDENYPNSGGTAYSSGTWDRFSTDGEGNETKEIRHKSGSFIYFDSNGDIYIQSVGNIYLHADKKAYLGGDKDCLVESAEGNTGVGSGMTVVLNGTTNVEVKTAANIIHHCGGSIIDDAKIIMHNCKLGSVMSALVAATVKEIGVTARSAVADISKKFKAVAATAEKKQEKLDSVLTGKNS